VKIDLQGLLASAGQAAGSHYRHALPELASNLVELRTRTLAGDLSALDEFFSIYVVNADPPPPPALRPQYHGRDR